MEPKASFDPSGTPLHWFDRGIALEGLRHHFQQCGDTIRIASGFFTIRGYSLIRASAVGKKILILVGLKDPGDERVKRVLIKEIMADLRKGIHTDRRQAVRELVKRIEGEKFRIVSARAMDHHAKLYLVDDSTALIGSSNLSENGLKKVIEAGYTIVDPAHVADYVRWYDEYFENSKDITQILLKILKKWLALARPWDIYLKTLDALRSLEKPQLERVNYRKPVSYQRNIVAKALRSIQDHSGAMVIASTGLGKTVIGTDIALRLNEAETIKNVLIIGPQAVEENWDKHFRPTGIYVCFFNPSAVNDSPDKNRHSRRLQDYLETLDERWLIIIDESHNFRNERQEAWEDGRAIREIKTAFKRLRPAIAKSKAKVLLMTATPLSTGVENINAQLSLLPKTAPPSRSAALSLLPDTDRPAKSAAWRIGGKLQELRELDVIVSMTTPYVAKHYALTDEETGELYINFASDRRYIPRVILHRVNTPLLLESEIISALEQKYFKTDQKHPLFKGNIELLIRTHWASSPWALRDVISKSIERKGWQPYNVTFALDVEFHRQASFYEYDLRTHKPDRKARLTPIIESLESLSFQDDLKLKLLVTILNKLIAENKKAIIFAEFHATVAYLDAALKELCPGLPVASLVKMNKPGDYELKHPKEIKGLLEQFAPIAHDLPAETGRYNVLLATDAYGVGVNMQDAQVVINYDLAWTPIAPVQRAGRVLRLWHSPRTVELFSFVPMLSSENQIKQEAEKFGRRWIRLTRRDRQSRLVVDLQTMTTRTEPVVVDMPTLAPTIESGELDFSALDREEETGDVIPVSPLFRHTAHLENYRPDINELADDLHSAMVYPGDTPKVYTLLRYKGGYVWALYDLKRRTLLPPLTDLQLLNLIECQETTPLARIPAKWIERGGNACVKAWCKAREVNPDQVERICTLYLTPDEQDDFSQLFE
ncbi:MAG: DEAD/DEAH box helicase family protein [Anaerolineae bacterium]|nr:DEAD/DEAH box helicase family protein [Anaerolineae bacterium]